MRLKEFSSRTLFVLVFSKWWLFWLCLFLVSLVSQQVKFNFDLVCYVAKDIKFCCITRRRVFWVFLWSERGWNIGLILLYFGVGFTDAYLESLNLVLWLNHIIWLILYNLVNNRNILWMGITLCSFGKGYYWINFRFILIETLLFSVYLLSFSKITLLILFLQNLILLIL